MAAVSLKKLVDAAAQPRGTMQFIVRFCGLAFVVLSILAAVAFVAPAAGSATEKEQAEGASRIAKLIEQLGSDDFGARERAQSELAQAGLEAYDALHAAQSHHDPEIALRARYLVRSMSVRWFADSDSPKVIAILKEYGDLQEAERRNRIDKLAALEDRLGVIPLIRLSRFETSDPLSKYAALQILEVSPPEDPAAKTKLAKDINAIVGDSKRTAAVWLRLYARAIADPAPTLAEWEQAAQAEHAALAKTPERTSREIVRDLYRYQADLLTRLRRSDEAFAVMRRTFSLIEGAADQVQETVDWLTYRQAWPVAREVLEKFDAVVQDNPDLLYRLASIYDKLGQPDKANDTAAKALSIHPEALTDHLLTGKKLEETPGLVKWAEAEYRHVMQSTTLGSKEDFRARYSLAELLHDRLQELPAAETLKEPCDLLAKDENIKANCENAFPTLGADHVVARMHYFFACHSHEQGNTAKEREHLQAAIDSAGDDADVLIAMYRLPQADEEWKAMTKEKIETTTAEYLREVEERRAGVEGADNEHSRNEAQRMYAIACNQYAWLVGNTFGDHPEAVKLSQESVKIAQQLIVLKPSVAGFLDTLGRAFYGAGDVANAVKHQAMAVSLSPHSGQIRRQLEFFKSEAKKRGIELTPERSAP
jgi:tetratricopeptide (TPR) repeat protein